MNSFKSWGKRVWVLAAMLAAWVWTQPALGDGKVFPAVAFPADVTIPDQSALIVWEDGVERLVIETRFVGEGTNFAWVVPLPSVPEIEPATTGLFPTLRYSFQPEVRHDVYSWWAAGLFVLGLAWLMVTVRRDEPRELADAMACLVTAVGFAVAANSPPVAALGGPALFFLLLLAANRVRGGRARAYAFLLAVLAVLVLSSLLLPALGKAGRAFSEEGGDLRVLDRRIVGVYETATIEAGQAGALFDWLNQNGFALDASSKPVVEDYVRDGWVFVACKVNRDESSAVPVTPHPLSFSFRTARAVYPLRLTGVGSSGLDLDLFVAGTGRARVNGFKVAECRPIDRHTYDGVWQNRGLRKLKHGQFVAWTQAASVVTRLEAKLTPADMQRDVEVEWEPFSGTRSRIYSNAGAIKTTANWILPGMGLALMVVGVLHDRKRLKSAFAARFALVTVLAASVGFLILYTVMPKVAVRLQKWPGTVAKMSVHRLGIQASITFSTNQPATLPAAREHIHRWLAEADRDATNVLLGGLIREEDSPGNYTLRETPEGIEILGYDTTGATVPVGFISGPKSP